MPLHSVRLSLIGCLLLLACVTARAQWTNYIEIEDYNFENGQFISDATCGMDGPYAGGAFSNKVGTVGVDWNYTMFRGGTTTFDRVYRTNDFLAGIYLSSRNQATNRYRGHFSNSYNWKIAWQNPGEWQNYTRVFSNAVYSVSTFAGSDVGVQMTLETVTSDPTQPDQTTVTNGYFNGPYTSATAGNGDSDTYWPLGCTDGIGQPLRLRLSGTNTLRVTQRLYGNTDFLIFVAIDGLAVMPPYIISATPAPNAVLSTPAPIDIAIRHGDNPVDVSQVRLLLNGTDVTSLANIYANSDDASVYYDFGTLSIYSTNVTLQIIYADTGSPATRVTNNWSFTTPATRFYIETEDYNYGSGQFISDASSGMGGQYYGGVYGGLTATVGVDYYSAPGTTNYNGYRGESSDLDLFDPAGVDWSYADLARNGFSLSTDYVVGEAGASEWQNYTRVFPDAWYNIYLRTAMSASWAMDLGLVASDRSLPSQTVYSIGTFSGGSTGSDLTQQTFRLNDAAGNPASVHLAGTNTLRLTALSPNNPNYLYLVPIPAASVIGPKLSITNSASGQMTLSWTGYGWHLETATDVASGPWSDVPGGALSPVTLSASGEDRFFRLSQ